MPATPNRANPFAAVVLVLVVMAAPSVLIAGAVQIATTVDTAR